MKPKDYMVGDWIATEHGFPMRVTAVGEDYIYADFEGNEGDVFEFDEKYMPNPIPLTKEIMFANGFENNGCRGVLVHKTDKDLKVYYDIDHFEGTDWIVKKWDVVGIFGIEYVHEYQHYLRLVGKSDFADSFKI